MPDFVTASDGIKVAYYIDDFTDPWTKPDTIFMLHSMMGNAGRFFSWVPSLSRKYRIVRVDLRGHGASDVPAPDHELSMGRLLKDAVEVMDALKLGKVHVLGNSSGGYVAQYLAMYEPARVKSLMLYGSTPGLAESKTNTWIPRIKKEGLEHFLRVTIADRFRADCADPALVEWFLQDAIKNNQDFICRWLEFASPLDWGNELTKVECPTLVVRPGAETVGTASTYDVMRDNIKDVEILTYSGMPHNICDFVPDMCVADVLSFLARRFPAVERQHHA